jgi:hypothetical protein
VAGFDSSVIRRQSCACGGDCPRCEDGSKSKIRLQRKLKISTPSDQYEQEADLVAEQVMRAPATRGDGQTQHQTPQTKLRVGVAGDQNEQEADQVTAQVSRMPEPQSPSLALSQVSPSLLQRKCFRCESEPGPDLPEKEVQRKARAESGEAALYGDDVAAHVDSSRGGGEPLSPSARAFFEPRFNHDFGGVRLHTGARAAASAQAVNARAYTIGDDVVFGAGEFAPETCEGRRLLAHELTHVIQQSPRRAVPQSDSSSSRSNHVPARGPVDDVNRGESPMVSRRTSGVLQRQTPDSNATTTTATVTGPNACSFAQHRIIAPADAHQKPITTNPDYAINWPWDIAVLGAMRRHFSATDRATVLQVYQRIVTINNDLTSRADLHVECHTTADTTCSSAAAYVTGANLSFCPSFFTGSAEWRAESLVHEMAHSLVGGPHITDRAYRADRLYRTLPTAEALTNAESYGLLVQELGTRRAQESTAPTDAAQHCPDDWQPLLRMATARAQRWNRNAQVSVDDRQRTWLSGWLDLQSTHLGVATAVGTDPTTNATLITALNSAKAVYDRVEGRLHAPLNFACEARAEGRCTTFLTYWDGGPPSPLHLCPAWRSGASESDRVFELLIGLYGYLGGLPDAQQPQRVNYARLARDLTSRFWP